MLEASAGERWRDPLLGAGLVCLAAFALPAWFPPGPAPLLQPAADATLLQRLFPEVPGWWVATRLGLLFGGALLVTARASSIDIASASLELRSAPPSWAIWTAWVFALLQLAAAFWADALPRPAQFLYAACLFGPAIWIAAFERSSTPSAPASRPWSAILWCTSLLILWVPWRLGAVWSDPRATSLGDVWYLHQQFEQALRDGANFLTTWHEPLVAASDMFTVAGDLFHRGELPSVATMQAFGVVWIAAAAVLTAIACSRLFTPRIAPLALAAVLAAPVSLALAHWVFPWGFLLTLVAGLLWALVELAQRRSMAAFLLLAPIVGLTLTQGFVLAYGAFALLGIGWLALWRWRFPPLVLSIFAFSCAATILPYAWGIDLKVFQEEVTGDVFPWAEVERLSYEQRAPLLGQEAVDVLERAGHRGPLDLIIGGALAPFAIPRTALRLLRDELLEPWTAALTAVGLLLALRWVRARPQYWWWLAAWGTGQIGMLLTSNYDRISPIRNMALPIASAPFVALSWTALSRRFPILAGVNACGAVALVMIVSQGVIHDWVDPTRLAASPVEIAIEATTDNRPANGAAVLDLFRGTEYVYVGRMLTHFPKPPLPVRPYQTPRDLFGDDSGRSILPGVVFWSPGMEEECHVSRPICARLPQATVYTIRARSGLTHTFAVSTGTAGDWSPRPIPGDRWSSVRCAEWVDPYPGEARQYACSPDDELRPPSAQP